MGTGASSYTPPPSPYRGGGDLVEKLQATGMLFRSIATAKPNNVAPVIIKNCREEYQHISDIKEPIISGRIADKMPKHMLVKGEYFLVQDPMPKASGDHSVFKPATKGMVPVFSSAQPTTNGLASMTKKLLDGDYSELLLFNVREEPVLFLKTGDDFLPYTIKTKENLKKCVVTGKVVKEADLFEANVRKEVIELATLNDDNKFWFYQNVEHLSSEPHVVPISVEDDLLVSEEVYARLAFSNHNVRYRRLCFPLDGPPSDLEVDHFICIVKDSLMSPYEDSLPAMLFICQTGKGRSTVATVMGHLVFTCVRKDPRRKQVHTDPSGNRYEKGDYLAIRKLVNLLPEGETMKQQVDAAIDQYSSQCNLRAEILNAKFQLEHMQHDPESLSTLYRQCRDFLARYFFLICFNAYIHEECQNYFSLSFVKWMQRHPEINRLRSNLTLPVYDTNLAILQAGDHSLVSDNYVGLDLLGSQLDLRVANFRKINIKNIPVYGMAQPANDGMTKVVNHLLGNKVRHTHLVLVNLRNDLTVECDGSTYSVRDRTIIEEPITFPGMSKTELEDKEEKLKRTVRSHKSCKLINELSDPAVERDVRSCYTILDLADNQKLQTLDMTYYRVPLLSDSSPVETDIDELVHVVCSHCKQEKLKDNSDTAFVFFCRTGKSRTTFSMAVAGLILCHIKGFPYGAGPGEQERISLPNAKYTRGEFIIVQKLIRMLPDGQQVKREVDFILDEIFNTMTPMMFHLREAIFVTYNETKKAKCSLEEEQLRCLSILYLERYIYLILFNAYLHGEKESHWKRPFTQWMIQVGGRAGVYELLDSLSFYDFDKCVSNLRLMTNRWRLQVPNIPFHGEFL